MFNKEIDTERTIEEDIIKDINIVKEEVTNFIRGFYIANREKFSSKENLVLLMTDFISKDIKKTPKNIIKLLIEETVADLD